MREHPDLPRQPVVLASLATAHAIWLERLAPASEATARKLGRAAGEGGPQLH